MKKLMIEDSLLLVDMEMDKNIYWRYAVRNNRMLGTLMYLSVFARLRRNIHELKIHRFHYKWRK